MRNQSVRAQQWAIDSPWYKTVFFNYINNMSRCLDLDANTLGFILEENGLLTLQKTAGKLANIAKKNLIEHQQVTFKPLLPTPLIKLSQMKEDLGIEIFVKAEGNNPTGSQKDRVALAHVKDCIRKGYSAMILATCGNYGRAVAQFAHEANIKTFVAIPTNHKVSAKTLAAIESAGGFVISIGKNYEEAILCSRLLSTIFNLYDANPGLQNSRLQINAYKDIAFEIISAGCQPDYVSIPVGNGTTFVGVYEGFKELYLKGCITKIPTMIAASIEGMNPIIHSYNSARAKVYMPIEPALIIETMGNKELVGYHSENGEASIQALIECNGFAVGVSEFNYTQLRNLLFKIENRASAPASCASIEAIRLLVREGKISPGAECVAVLTS